ncbi:MAG: hypothetical protein IPL26_00160 [Leptospiraceae bacterium]|nr:hypothetical protein [Leptospiraceae bacterium]
MKIKVTEFKINPSEEFLKTKSHADATKLVTDWGKRNKINFEYVFDVDGRIGLTDKELMKADSVGILIPEIEITQLRVYEYERPTNLIPVAIGIGLALLVAFSGKKKKKK